jgi:hypothetical protein
MLAREESDVWDAEGESGLEEDGVISKGRDGLEEVKSTAVQGWEVVGDEGSEPHEERSSSDNRHAWEQYAPPSV